jgi:hypothetical protein
MGRGGCAAIRRALRMEVRRREISVRARTPIEQLRNTLSKALVGRGQAGAKAVRRNQGIRVGALIAYGRGRAGLGGRRLAGSDPCRTACRRRRTLGSTRHVRRWRRVRSRLSPCGRLDSGLHGLRGPRLGRRGGRARRLARA